VNATEWIGTIFGLLCVWLTAKENLWCWPTGLANNLFFAMLFGHDRLYADFSLQIVYVALGLYGWYEWLRGGPNRETLAVSRTPSRIGLLLAPLFLLSTVAIVWSLRQAVAWVGAPAPDYLYWDSATTAAALVAQWMLARKWLENWVIWIGTNVSYIALYGVKGRFLLCLLQVMFIWLSINGFRRWRRSLVV
jgi:nicotinamide mononucleotide transporter